MRALRFPDELRRFGPKENGEEGEVVAEENAEGGNENEAADGDDL
jgi:hypothetical protein